MCYRLQMKRIFVCLGVLVGAGMMGSMSALADDFPVAIVIHGGAGSVDRATFTPEKEGVYRAVLGRALARGKELLDSGASSLDAVEAALVILEDSPVFNAGKGAVFTDAGRNELDASIMNGATLEAGAVGGVTRVKNPIRAARAVMEPVVA